MSAETSVSILPTQNRNCWPVLRTNFGPGTSRRFVDPPGACTSNCTSSWMSSAATWWAGRSPHRNPLHWPRISFGQNKLIIHSDRGPVMVSKTYVQLLTDLAVEGSYSRPYRSNDNPYSEAHFRTAKYHRTYEPRFGSLEDARSWARQFFEWYNYEFYHSEIALMHPATLHYGQARKVWQARQRVMKEAYDREPARFIRGVPKIPMPRRAAWINRPDDAQAASLIEADRVAQASRNFALTRDQLLPA